MIQSRSSDLYGTKIKKWTICQQFLKTVLWRFRYKASITTFIFIITTSIIKRSINFDWQINFCILRDISIVIKQKIKIFHSPILISNRPNKTSFPIHFDSQQNSYCNTYCKTTIKHFHLQTCWKHKRWRVTL